MTPVAGPDPARTTAPRLALDDRPRDAALLPSDRRWRTARDRARDVATGRAVRHADDPGTTAGREGPVGDGGLDAVAHAASERPAPAEPVARTGGAHIGDERRDRGIVAGRAAIRGARRTRRDRRHRHRRDQQQHRTEGRPRAHHAAETCPERRALSSPKSVTPSGLTRRASRARAAPARSAAAARAS